MGDCNGILRAVTVFGLRRVFEFSNWRVFKWGLKNLLKVKMVKIAFDPSFWARVQFG